MNETVVVKGINSAEAAKYETLFRLLDVEGKGSIDEGALADLMPRMGMFLSEEDLHTLFAHVDKDGSGGIEFYEFLELMSHHRESSQLSLLEGGNDETYRLLQNTGSRGVLRPDDPLSWILDILVLAAMQLYLILITYEDVYGALDQNRGFLIKTPPAALLVIDVVRGMFTIGNAGGSFAFVATTPAMARAQYLKSRKFIIDLVSSVPVDILFLALGFDAVMIGTQHIRLVKILSYPSLFSLTARDTLTPFYAHFYFVFVPLCKMFFGAVTVVHLLSMAWVRISPQENGMSVSYIDAVYFVVYTLTTTGYGDIPVSTDAQKAFAIFLFCCASVVTGLVVGKLVQFSQQADLQTDANKRMLETLAALNHLTIPQNFKEEVLGFQLHLLRHQGSSLFNETLSALPQVMQDRMALYARMKIVRQMPIFAKAQEICVAKLAQSLVNVCVPPEEYIVIAGEEGEEMFFLFHGMCEVTLPDGRRVATLPRGAAFGELALLEETRRSASIKSLTYCHLFRLDKRNLDEIVERFPVLLDAIQSGSTALHSRIETRDNVSEDDATTVTESQRTKSIGSSLPSRRSVYQDELARMRSEQSENNIERNNSSKIERQDSKVRGPIPFAIGASRKMSLRSSSTASSIDIVRENSLEQEPSRHSSGRFLLRGAQHRRAQGRSDSRSTDPGFEQAAGISIARTTSVGEISSSQIIAARGEDCCCKMQSSAIQDLRDKVDRLLKIALKEEQQPSPGGHVLSPPTHLSRCASSSALRSDANGDTASSHGGNKVAVRRAAHGATLGERDDQSLKRGASASDIAPGFKRGTSSIGIRQLFGGAAKINPPKLNLKLNLNTNTTEDGKGGDNAKKSPVSPRLDPNPPRSPASSTGSKSPSSARSSLRSLGLPVATAAVASAHLHSFLSGKAN